MSTDFFIACFRDNVGSNVGWHSKDGRGYTTDIDKAHVYSLEEAQRAWDRAREFDQPVSASHVKTLSVFKVDCQYVPHVTEIDASNQYVAFVRSKWDGNDLFFLTRTLPSTDFSKAKTFSRGEIEGDDQLIFIPQSLAEKAKRRTFDYSKLNNRKMVQAMGLRIPDHIKRYRRARPSTGKVRWNCPSCGRIHWQHNPHDFEGCSNINCEEWCL